MLKLRLPFSIAEEPNRTCPRDFGRGVKVDEAKLWLEGLSISVEIAGRSYRVCSEHAPEPNQPGAYQGTIWPLCVLPLPGGATIEQQTMLPIGGNAVAASWRLLGGPDTPATIRVSPIFSASERFAATAFEGETKTAGGRLTWRPFRSSSKIIADTNGRPTKVTPSLAPSVVPVAFEFDLGQRPAVLILRAELATATSLNPLIGGFLAGLTEEREQLNHHDPQHRLAA